MTVSRRGILAAAGIGAVATAGSALIGTAQADEPDSHGRHHGQRIVNGADIAAADGWKILQGRRVGVITNPTGVLADFTSIVDDMVARKVNVGAVFGPEHGFRGTAQAGESEDTFVDERTGVTVYDAYSANVATLVGFYQQAKVDTIVFDIRDVGARFYTYIWTMWTAMQAAATTGARFVVLDRPNPLGGKARGPVLKQGYESGVGELEIAQQHGMTVGELARFFNGTFMKRVGLKPIKELDVVKAHGWHREMTGPDDAPHWVPPSPNMPTPQTATLYPGTGMFEATNMSEGRGTTRPFELIGAPYVDYKWAAALNKHNLAGVEFREAYFVPTFSKNADKVCGGVQVHLMDEKKVDAITVAAHMLVAARDLYAGFDWRGDGGRWMDLLTGSSRFRKQLDAGASAQRIIAAWQPELKKFVADTAKFLLYRGRRL